MTYTIFFDFGWTLEDESGSHEIRTKKVLPVIKKFGISTTYHHLIALQNQGAKELVASPFSYSLNELGLSKNQILEIRKLVPWEKSYLKLYPGVKKLLEELKNRKYTLGLIANQSTGLQNRLHKYRIDKYFDFVISSADIGIEKPELMIFKMAQKKANSNSEKIWMIGDRIDNDIFPANCLGWNTIRILNGYNTNQTSDSEKYKPTYTVKKIDEILGILELHGKN